VRSFEAHVAERYLTTRKKGAFVRVMVRFARWGIALGVFALVVAMALMNGFAQEIQANLFKATAHFTVAHLMADLPDTAGALAKLRATPGVVAASPIRFEKGLLRLPGRDAAPEAVAVKAVDPVSAGSTSSIFDTLRPTPISALQEGEVVVGRELAQRLSLRVGDTVALTTARFDQGLGGLQPKVMALKLAGLFESHISEYDKGWVFMHLADAQRLARTQQAEMIEVRATNIDAIDAVKPAALKALGAAYVATDLRETNKTLFAALRVEKWLFAIVLALIVLVAAFNIVASLVLLVTEKRRDLGVLLALGATPAQVQRLFELQGLRIGAVGTAWGLGLGLPFCWLADHFRIIKLPAAVYDFITYLPFRLSAFDVLLVAVFPLAVSWWAARYPARRAAHTDPVDALRSE
jgi:lipoprotein-releasing system permease protein